MTHIDILEEFQSELDQITVFSNNEMLEKIQQERQEARKDLVRKAVSQHVVDTENWIQESQRLTRAARKEIRSMEERIRTRAAAVLAMKTALKVCFSPKELSNKDRFIGIKCLMTDKKGIRSHIGIDDNVEDRGYMEAYTAWAEKLITE